MNAKGDGGGGGEEQLRGKVHRERIEELQGHLVRRVLVLVVVRELLLLRGGSQGSEDGSSELSEGS